MKSVKQILLSVAAAAGVALISALTLVPSSARTVCGEPATQEQDYVIRKVPQVPYDQLLNSIVSQYKGQIVLIDFWATWCGPCRAAMEEIEPLKSGIYSGAKYVYITSQTSPRGVWEKMIRSIKGDHYYLSNAQLQAIFKQIGTDAFPTYLVVGKDGVISEPFIGFSTDVTDALELEFLRF